MKRKRLKDHKQRGMTRRRKNDKKKRNKLFSLTPKKSILKK